MAHYPGFVGVSDTSQSPLANAERLVNWYYESLPQNAKNRAALYPTPGFVTWQTVQDVGGRALFTENGRTFGIVGGGAYEFFSTATASRYGALAQDNNPGQIVTNGVTGAQVLYASGTNAYNLSSSNVLTQVITGDATMVGLLDGYGIYFNPTTSKIRISNLDDFTTNDPTQFAQRSAASDSWKAMIVNAPDIWLVGEKDGDVWYDAGTFPFPLAPRIGLSYKFGIIAPFTLAKSGNTVMWLSRNEDGAGIVVRTRGYSPIPISSLPLETAISQYQRSSTIADAEGFVYQQEGHTFYVLTFPSVPATWACDLDENKWAERGYWNPGLNQYQLWRPRAHTYAFGMHLTADRSTGQICTMDVTSGTEADGSVIRRLREAPGIFNEHRQIPIRNIEVYLQAGAGTVTGAGSDPHFIWQTSDDGGFTWGNERYVSALPMGQYQAKLRMWRFGTPHDRVNRMVCTDPIPWRIIDAYVNNDGPQ